MSYEYGVKWMFRNDPKAKIKQFGQAGAEKAFVLADELRENPLVVKVRLQRRWVTPWRDVEDDLPGSEPPVEQ